MHATHALVYVTEKIENSMIKATYFTQGDRGMIHGLIIYEKWKTEDSVWNIQNARKHNCVRTFSNKENLKESIGKGKCNLKKYFRKKHLYHIITF